MHSFSVTVCKMNDSRTDMIEAPQVALTRPHLVPADYPPNYTPDAPPLYEDAESFKHHDVTCWSRSVSIYITTVDASLSSVLYVYSVASIFSVGLNVFMTLLPLFYVFTALIGRHGFVNVCFSSS